MKPINDKYGHFEMPASVIRLHNKLVKRGDYSRISEMVFTTNEYRNVIHAAISKGYGELNVIEGIKKYYEEKSKKIIFLK